MGNGHRKKPFSGKQKKKQLQAKRAKNSSKREEDSDNEAFEALDIHVDESKHVKNEGGSLNKEQISNNKDDNITLPSMRKLFGPSKRLNSVFEKLSPREIKAQRKASMNAFTRLPSTALEVSIKDIYTTIIDFPKRPPWHYGMTKEELETNEEHSFQRWLDDVYDKYPREELSFFEHNLDVWRQLWRVLEISDIILIVVDIRHPLLHFTPSLYNYVVKDMKRKMILVFNKIDLVAEHTVYAWTKYFEEQFPEISIVGFSCYSKDNRIIDDTSTASLQKRMKRPKKRRYQALGIKELLIACKLIKQGVEVNWIELIEQYNRNEAVFDNLSDNTEGKVEKIVDNESQETSSDVEPLDIGEESIKQIENQIRVVDIQSTETSPHKNLITIGLVGHPNVGKSSLINSILGRTVVSISRTPGHTKHFQTIHLSKNVRLCDSPGLVFPSLLPKQLQILSGLFPISQVQEPYSTIQYIAERIPLESILKLDPPENLKNNEWSAWYLCEAFAIKRRYYTKAPRPDVYRAANAILRLINDGRILLSFKPPGFFTSLKYLILQRDDADLPIN
ncbi:P-loop containing nucleoside triphosphate hydrolase protein [Glomus cerebriforme]|uniref:Guanine nucleotide-binding protein-like 1 n=1 Tax=Glomus cerebriforme TaxID=658196 RepID=A0A397SLV8_9GLOM|nr:P-loop containing nucleoside triphosphate hydrolase protein [Glomus cerebriforme]